MKNYKYLLAAAAITVTGGLLSSCSDDDDKNSGEVQLPAAIEITATQTNLSWDEKETYVNFSATQKWTVQSDANWIEPEMTKGDGGTYRLFITTDPNTYLFPRSGNLTITCGDKVPQ